MNTDRKYLLTVNAGSSSIKLVLFAADGVVERLQEAVLESIGQPSASLVTSSETTPVGLVDHVGATQILTDWLKREIPKLTISAVGHRIVHGGPKHHVSKIIDNQMITDLRELSPFDPEHLPIQIQLIETLQGLFPGVHQVACFDTAFHHNLPTRARLLPIPRHFASKGIRRYGFHGLSYAYILEELKRVEGTVAANGKVIVAHLGSGSSLAALHKGQSIDTTMSMTPVSGVPMSTRSGDLDPGLLLYLARTQGYDIEHLNHMANFESGLLGISETTPDMKKLLDIELQDQRAKEAIEIFCYQIRKSIGGLTAALNGLNTLVFTGGIGEKAPKIRQRVCDGLGHLGVIVDTERNQAGARLISANDSQVGVHVIHTDEATTIAHETFEIIKSDNDRWEYESDK